MLSKKRIQKNITKLLFNLRKLLPRTIFVRVILLITISLFTIQTIFIIILYDSEWREIRRALIRNLASNISHVVYLAENTKNDAELESLINNSRLVANLSPQIVYEYSLDNKELPEITTITDLFYTYLKRFLPNNNNIYINEYDERYSIVRLSINIKDNIYLSFYLEKELFFSDSLFNIMILTIMLYVLLVAIIINFFRIQFRPLKKLAEAAENFGRGVKVDYIVPSGSQEIHRVTVAFNEMKDQIENFIEQRLLMLSGITHDLKTSLSKISSNLNTDSNNIYTNTHMNDIQNEIKNMQEMLNSYLEFAKNDYYYIEKKDINIKSFFDKVKNIYTTNNFLIEIELLQGNKTINAHEISIMRVFDNLISNATKYAKNIKITVMNLGNRNLQIDIEDDGIGIAEKDYVNVFKPFFRLNEDKKPDTSSLGLGLSIVKDIIAKHGGNLKFSHSDSLGGLKITIILPY